MPRPSLRAGERRLPLCPHSRSQRGRCHYMGDQPQEGHPQASDGESPSRAVGSVRGLADRALPNTHQLDGQPRTAGSLVIRPLEPEPLSPRRTSGAVSPTSGRRPGPGLRQSTHKSPMKPCCAQSGSASTPPAEDKPGNGPKASGAVLWPGQPRPLRRPSHHERPRAAPAHRAHSQGRRTILHQHAGQGRHVG